MNPIHFSILAGILTVATIACLLSSNGVTVSAQTSDNISVDNKTNSKDSDERMVDVEKDMPGFGGVFMDKNKVLNVYMVSSKMSKTQTDAEKSINLEKHLGKGHLSKGMIILEGKYTFSELLFYKQKLSSLLDQKINVTAVGIDDSKNLVMVGVEKIDDEGLVIKDLSNLGVPREAVAIVEIGKITLENHALKYRPVTGGVQISFDDNNGTIKACSVGMSADRGGSRVIVTAGHCSAPNNRDSTYYYQCCQNSTSDGIGGGISGTNPIHSRYSDTVLISPTVSTSRGVVHRDSGGDLTLLGKQYVDVVGDSISMSGRTSMDQSGVITQRCMNTTSTTYGYLPCQDYASYANASGDSGGTVYGIDINSGTYKWYGTHWGVIGTGPYSGNSIFSTVQDIENDQGTLDIGPTSPTCVPPSSGDWMPTSSCTLAYSATAHANVIISSNVILTIPNGNTLNENLQLNHLLVKSGGQVHIEPNGKISP